MKLAVVKTGGKQYIVSEGSEIIVDKVKNKNNNNKCELVELMVFDTKTGEVQVGTPYLKTKSEAEIIEEGKGEKIRVARFKAKSRYRKVKGFRPHLSKLKIISI